MTSSYFSHAANLVVHLLCPKLRSCLHAIVPAPKSHSFLYNKCLFHSTGTEIGSNVTSSLFFLARNICVLLPTKKADAISNNSVGHVTNKISRSGTEIAITNNSRSEDENSSHRPFVSIPCTIPSEIDELIANRTVNITNISLVSLRCSRWTSF